MPCQNPNLSFSLENAIKGNTWPGLSISFTSDGTTFDEYASVAKFRVVDKDGVEALSLTSPVGVTIDDADAWEFIIDPITPLTIPAGVYAYAFEVTDNAGVIRTWLAGTWRIVEDAVL